MEPDTFTFNAINRPFKFEWLIKNYATDYIFICSCLQGCINLLRKRVIALKPKRRRNDEDDLIQKRLV